VMGTCISSSTSIVPTYQSGLPPPVLDVDTMSRSTRDAPTHPSVARLKELQESSFAYLSEALNIDETEDELNMKARALPLYEKGIDMLKRGVGIHVPMNQSDASLVRAHKLKAKMAGNLVTVEERYNFLKTSLHLNCLSLEADRANEIHNGSSRPMKTSAMPRPNLSAREKLRKPDKVMPAARQPRNNKAAELRIQSRSGGKTRDEGVVTKSAKGKSDLKSKCMAVKGLDPKLVETILNEVVPNSSTGVKFSDVSGQEKAKGALHEMVVLPALRPELFTGLRSPAKGLLLFGPPGNGKTLLARALATEAKSNLVNISASSVTSKWVGEGEKLVRTLFSVARAIQPVIIFVDEIDSLLSERRTGEHEAMRRIKTEFLLQFEGMLTGGDERIVVVAATNRPQELDDAALRRFTKRIYVEMPDKNGRIALVSRLISKHGSPLSSSDLDKVGRLTEGYTCSDITNLARDAAMSPLREISTAQLVKIKPEDMRAITIKDFEKSCERVRKSLSPESLVAFKKWNISYGDVS